MSAMVWKASQPAEASEDTRDLLAKMIHDENDAVFEAVIASYGDCIEMEFAQDLRHAAGMRDDFGAHVRFSDDPNDIANQEKFFSEYGLSMREFDCASVVIGNRFYF